MNAPVKHASLESRYAQRKALLAKRAEIAASREKLAELDAEVETTKRAMHDFANRAADAVEVWSTGGCRGSEAMCGLWRSSRA